MVLDEINEVLREKAWLFAVGYIRKLGDSLQFLSEYLNGPRAYLKRKVNGSRFFTPCIDYM